MGTTKRGRRDRFQPPVVEPGERRHRRMSSTPNSAPDIALEDKYTRLYTVISLLIRVVMPTI